MSSFGSARHINFHQWLLCRLSERLMQVPVELCLRHFRGQTAFWASHHRLAWALVAGGGSWCAEAAARHAITLQGAALRREIFSHLDAWLHANSYSSRTLYAALLDRLKVMPEVTTACSPTLGREGKRVWCCLCRSCDCMQPPRLGAVPPGMVQHPPIHTAERPPTSAVANWSVQCTCQCHVA